MMLAHLIARAERAIKRSVVTQRGRRVFGRWTRLRASVHDHADRAGTSRWTRWRKLHKH